MDMKEAFDAIRAGLATAGAHQSHLDALDKQIAVLPDKATLAALEERVTALENGSGSSTEATELADLESRVSTLEQGIAGLGAGLGGYPAGVTLSFASEPKPVVGQAFTAQVEAFGGSAPYQFSIESGALPAGLSMASGGLISGTPTTIGDFSVDLQAHDANGTKSATFTWSGTVAAAAPAPAAEPTA